MKLPLLLLNLFWLALPQWAGAEPVSAKKDPGKDPVGELEVRMIYATNEDQVEAGASAKSLEKEVVAKLSALPSLKFTHYRLLGSDTQPVWRSYVNWGEPVKGADQILLSFQPRGTAKGKSMRLDLELWQQKKKVLKADPMLQEKKPLYILGPKWRKGRIIISVNLIKVG